MKLSFMVWEYLAREEVFIKSIYEIDNGFKELMETAETLLDRISSNSISEEEFEKLFLHVFEINDSFDNIIELVPSGSKTKVRKENLYEFIEIAKNKRLYDFNDQLKDLKEGFDKVMTQIVHFFKKK